MVASDWPAVRRIYVEGIASGHATFETTGPDGWGEWSGGKLPAARLVARRGGVTVGWSALSPVSSRPAYRGVAEVSVYVAADARGGGVGSVLLAGLVAASEAAGVWTLQANVFPENVASVRLHLRLGFRVVGHRERIGRHHGVWRDTVLLERRSPVV
jgi:L-amino acid N-acyltransferase YncA